MSESTKRPMEGWYLRDGLKRLATICAIADGMRYSLEPLSDEEISAGAEPLTPTQMQEELGRIALIATQVALEEMQATSEEWYAANNSIE